MANWEDLSLPEKIEDLHRDVVRLFAAYNNLNQRLGGVANFVDEARDGVKKVEAQVAALSDRLTKIQGSG